MQNAEQGVDLLIAENAGKCVRQSLFGFVVGETEQTPETHAFGIRPVGAAAMQGNHAGKRAALAENSVDDLAEIILRRHRHDLVERASKRAVAICCGTRHRCIECGALQPEGFRLIEHGEMRRDLRLERKALQQPLAEAVDGVDLEAAFGFERLSEETARRLHFRVAGGAAEKRRESCPQLLVRKRGPASELAEQPVLHLGGRHLGVGEAEDVLRL